MSERLWQDMLTEADRNDRLAAGYKLAGDRRTSRSCSDAARACRAAALALATARCIQNGVTTSD